MSLLLTIDPETSDAKFTEADLKPNLKVIHQNSGKEYTLTRHGQREGLALWWSLTCEGDAMQHSSYCTLLGYGDMLSKLNADFRRVDATGGVEKPLKDVEPGSWFRYGGNWYVVGNEPKNHFIDCWSVSYSCIARFTESTVVPCLGPVRIDPRILEGE